MTRLLSKDQEYSLVYLGERTEHGPAIFAALGELRSLRQMVGPEWKKAPPTTCEVPECCCVPRVCRPHHRGIVELYQASANERCRLGRERHMERYPGAEHAPHLDSCDYTKGRFDAESYLWPATEPECGELARDRAVRALVRAIEHLNEDDRRLALALLAEPTP